MYISVNIIYKLTFVFIPMDIPDGRGLAAKNDASHYVGSIV